jgi:ABC-type uncharacterized transport system permease subunit
MACAIMSAHIMTNPWLNFLALALYLASAGLLAVRLAHAEPAVGGTRTGILGLVAGAVVLHAATLYAQLGLGAGLNLALTSAFSLIAWVVAALFLLGTIARPIENLGVLILPAAALTILIEWLWPGSQSLREASGPAAVHIAVSVIAYGLLTLAAAQALLVFVQEQRLRHKHPGGFLHALPPAQTMETLMFQMIAVGFLLLTATLVSGVFFTEQVFGRPFKLTHHILLSALGWVVYGVLLLGRWRLGWRGRVAVRWTLVGFGLLVLGYFGSKFVLEVLLGRTG